ncbi:MAG TPA: glycosyltransferase family 9 protein [Candidatus Polarisedimenticolia bacterium]|nr:glycosyltransferase family 9 protein [Candidatus Polarisedimenticolia bacterium]
MERPVAPLGRADRVLVVRLGAVGDVIRALPALHRLRLTFPGAHLAWVVEDLAAPLLERHPDLNEVIRLSRRDLRAAGRSPRRLARTVSDIGRRLRAGRYDVAVDLQSSLKSGILTVLSGARRRVGFAPGHCREMSFLFTNEWAELSSPCLNRVDRNLEMAAQLGAAEGPVSASLGETASEGAAAEGILASLSLSRGGPVLLCPGASRRQAFKRWPAAAWGRLGELLAAAGTSPIIVWGPGEEGLAEEIERTSRGGARRAPSTSLPLLAALLRRSALFIGADTGPMHLAWAVGCPVVALFGPTDPRLNAPYGDGHEVLAAPEGELRRLAPETVSAAALRMLARRPR